jgi:colanic acid/amylovoran biosynthesis protein
MTRILFTNTNCSINKGSAAQVVSTAGTLKRLIPDIEIVLMSHLVEPDKRGCESLDIRVAKGNWCWVPNSGLLRHLYQRTISPLLNILFGIIVGLGINPKYLRHSILQEFASADVIVDLSGDSFADSKGGFSIDISSSLLFASAFKKPLIVYSQSIGPFGWFSKGIARYALNKTDLVIVREEITRDYLEKLGVRAPLHLTADCAFLLDPAPRERVEHIVAQEKVSLTHRPVVGVSANAMFKARGDAYASSKAQLLYYVIEQLNASIVVVPHVVGLKGRTDQDMGERIRRLMKHKDSVSLIQGDYSPEELKGIIALCDIFIGGRMHANIAALSSHVPTMTAAWNPKYWGIMRTLGQEEYVCDYTAVDFAALQSRLDRLWQDRHQIATELKKKVEEQKRLAWHSGELVRDLLNQRRSG